jgi:hypothetical protein
MVMLLELTPAETAFLTVPLAAPDGLPERLTRKLGATLTARLRMPVQAMSRPAAAPLAAPARPVWQPDSALATLWLTRRLGGQRVAGEAGFVPKTLLHTLDTALAECWLDATSEAAPPAALAWQVSAGLTQATLAVQLPDQPTDMTRWAREVIRHG